WCGDDATRATNIAATSTNASQSNSIYGASDTVQPPATQMYLYFYVGNFEQSAIEQTAGLNAEMFNDLNAHRVIEFQAPTASNGYTWYRKYADGWVEQGGTINARDDAKVTITFPVAFSLTPQVFIGRLTDPSFLPDTVNKRFVGISGVGTTSFSAWGKYENNNSYWLATGKAA
ncbi:MAG: hypothetical protein KIG16_04650, partial [Eubacteriales bacterium]|nr:hypothetical protein [Eubacteriales bacterium]